MCMVDDAEPFAVYVEEWRKCAKPFKCCECGREVAKGERYSFAKGLYDGCWETFKMCPHCKTFAAAWLTSECGGFLFHGVYEDLQEHREEELDPADSIPLLRAIVGMRRKWRKRDGTLMPVAA